MLPARIVQGKRERQRIKEDRREENHGYRRERGRKRNENSGK